MRIAMIGHKHFNPLEGGIEKVVYEQATRMAARGHEVICYDRGSKGLYGADEEARKLGEASGIRITTIPTVEGAAEVPLYSFLATFRAVRDGCDVICFHASGSCNMIPIGRLFGKRCVGLIHGIDSKRNKWHGFAVKYLEHGEKTAAKKAHACLVLSEHLNRQSWDEIWTSPEAEKVREIVRHCDRQCWMIGSVSPAMHKYIWKPAWWVFRHRIKFWTKKKYSMYELKVVRDLRDGKVTKEQLDACSTCEGCGGREKAV